MKIITFPHPNLRIKAKKITHFTQNLKKQAKQMIDLMYQHQGIGLAATQVNLQIRLFVMDTSNQSNNPQVFINPQFIPDELSKTNSSEGCLSLPSIQDTISRYPSGTIKYFNLIGEKQEQKVEDLDAICIQHEIDHLNGILFIDYLPEKQKQKHIKKLLLQN